MSCFVSIEIFFFDATNLPPQQQTDYVIPLTSGISTVNVKPYRYGYFQKDEISRLVTEMLAMGIIHPSSSSFSSPVLLVRMKDGSWHSCADYCALDRATIPYRYLIPVITKLLDELNGARYF